MRITAFAGLLVCALIATGSPIASAEALGLSQVDKFGNPLPESAILAQIGQTIEEDTEPATEEQPAKPEPKKEPAKPKIQKYKVAENDTLSTIAKRHNTTWKRLFNKNKNIENQDIIKVGDELIIPRPDEKLKDRPIVELVPEPATTPASNGRSRAVSTSAPRTRGSSSGNLYIRGYCTWYAKNRRPDLPNNLGNADTWVARASAQGIPTGSAPRAGAIGQQGMHVVYIERVNSNGTVTVSEMNFKGFGVVSSRTVPANNFRYIY